EKLYISIGKQAEEEVKVIFNDTVSKLKTIQGETKKNILEVGTKDGTVLKLNPIVKEDGKRILDDLYVNITFDKIGGRASDNSRNSVPGLNLRISKWDKDHYYTSSENVVPIDSRDINTPSLQARGYDKLKISVYSTASNINVEEDETHNKEVELVRYGGKIYPYVPPKNTKIVPPYSKDVIEKNKYQSPLMFYKDKDNICLRHGLSMLSAPDISYEICNHYGDPMVNGTLVSTNTKSNSNTLEILIQELVPLMHMEDGTDANRLIIKANGLPIFDDTLDNMQTSLCPDCDKASGIKATLAYSNLNLNLTSSPPSYSQICLNPLEPGILKVLEKFEVKVKGQSLNKEPHPIGKPQTDGKIIINCFDYNSDEKTH
ncbi:hypothetical protein ACLBXI_30090, partial [Bacillus cereus]